jgi:hypothetical protein
VTPRNLKGRRFVAGSIKLGFHLKRNRTLCLVTSELLLMAFKMAVRVSNNRLNINGALLTVYVAKLNEKFIVNYN